MEKCDLKISGASIVDGTGNPTRKTNVVISADKIEAVGSCENWEAEKTIDATGLVLAPGFIDVHTHDDLAVIATPDLPAKISQGVTTVIVGNCGISAAPMIRAETFPAPLPMLGTSAEFQFQTVKDYQSALRKKPAAVNVALLAGHSSLRHNVMSDRMEQPATSSDIATMKKSLQLALKQGCIGFSTGLDYPIAAAAPTQEVIEIASVLREFDNALYVTHMRDEGDEIMAAIEETLEIGRKSEAPIVISHHKCAGPKNYGRSVETLAAIDAARQNQQNVMFDVYPYTASATSLLPNFIAGSEAILVAESTPYPEYNGWMLDKIAAEWQCSLVDAAEKLYPASAIYYQMDDGDLERIMSHPAAMIGSDGLPTMKFPHPRLWGTFPRVLGHYVRNKKLFKLEQAVHKMTGLSAKTFGLKNRGTIEQGNFADMVLFDSQKIIDRSDFENPTQLADGIHTVWVNGDVTWQSQASTGKRGGKFLTH